MSTIRTNPSPKIHSTLHVSRRLHGILDYLGGVILILAGAFVPFPDDPMRMMSVASGAVLLFYSAGTDYEMGLLRFIPFPIHRGADLVLGTALAFSPIHFAVHGLPAILFIAIGAMLIFLGFFTQGEASNTGVDRPILPGA